MDEDTNGIEAVTREWEEALANHDVEGLLACYAPDATLESPVVAHILGGRGVCQGHEQLRPFLTEVVARTPDERNYHRAGFFTDGHRATWEYPRSTPDGEQMDFVEVMEIENGLIHAHRVYWGWRGVQILAKDEYHRPQGTPDGRTVLATVVSHDLITTPFGLDSTAAEVIAGVDLSGKRAIVTGASSGIGVETARALADAGADVTLAVRDTAAGGRIAEQIGGQVDVVPLDLTAPTSIAAFVAAWDGPLHILVNNAGVMAIQELTLSATGHEMQFATNHLGHFALATGLHGALAGAGGARIVSVSSSGHLRSPVIFDDIDYAFREYDPFGAYGQSKTANVLFAVEASTRWAGDGITANALMPGGILTALQRHLDPDYGKDAEERFRRAGSRLKNAEQGAATSTLLAASPLLDGVGGRYFEDCNEAPVIHRRDELTIAGVAPYALDPENAARLWDLSAELIG